MSSGVPRVDSVSSDCGVLGFLAHQQSIEHADNDDFRKGFFAFSAAEALSFDLNADHQARDISADALSGESSVEVPSLDHMAGNAAISLLRLRRHKHL